MMTGCGSMTIGRSPTTSGIPRMSLFSVFESVLFTPPKIEYLGGGFLNESQDFSSNRQTYDLLPQVLLKSPRNVYLRLFYLPMQPK